ncbi:MAG: lycopene cyclase domain-containing protein [Salinibacter sp.]|uniref:lycopene cyclase domain-containing protein n=1 Tax=Salinibacter sp. TaxID=2065818 RepID=UPI0035D4E601
MTYLTFHFTFLLPPILLMLLAPQLPTRSAQGTRAILGVPLICLIALTYTTPWDNYLVAKDIWWYGADRVLATIGYVPVEEYLFFVLQPLLTGLFLYQYLGRWASPPRKASRYAPWTGAGAFAVLTGMGLFFLQDGRPQTLYMALILIWAPPLLAGMWLYDGETLWSYRSCLLRATGIPTLYLWVADATAIHKNIWTISPKHTIGIKAFGLPVEEATFFLLTNLLVTQGLLLLLYGSHEAVAVEEARL